MERKKQNGHLARLFAVIISRVKTARANISEYLSSRRIARLLTLTMMCVLSLTSVGVLLLGTPFLTSSAAVDYSKPIQKISTRWANFISPSSMTTEQNNWRQSTTYYNVVSDADLSSFRLSAYASNNYGVDFDIWLTVISNSNNQVIYNSGWKSSPIVDEPLYIGNTTTSVRVVIRIRYNDDSGFTNPPSNNEFTNISWVINYDYYVNYSDDNLPEGWAATTTVVNTDIPVTALTTTTYINWDEQISGNNGFFETLRYSVSTIFGIGDSWQSAVYVMNYMNDRLPYVFAIGAFCGMVGIAVWFLEK